MRTKSAERVGAKEIVAVARAFGTAVASLVLGAALCLGLLFGGVALAAGAVNVVS
jgi:hypothetical protein